MVAAFFPGSVMFSVLPRWNAQFDGEDFFPKQLEEGEITWYIQLWDKAKQVMMWMPGGWA